MASDIIKVGDKFIIHPVAHRIKDRCTNRNMNSLCVVCGQTGSGKSYISLGLANIVDPTFADNVEKRVCFTVRQFRTLLADKEHELPKSAAVIFDEIGVDWNARRFQSAKNIQMGDILQTCRYKNLAVFMTVPALRMVDLTARRLMHFYLESKYVEQSTQRNVYKGYGIEMRPFEGESWKRNIYYVGWDGMTCKLGVVKQDKPPDKVCNVYERIARRYKDSILEDSDEKKEKKGRAEGDCRTGNRRSVQV